jgi:hypothetical protein
MGTILILLHRHCSSKLRHCYLPISTVGHAIDRLKACGASEPSLKY